MTPDERWLAAIWPLVRDSVPSPPGQVVEIGCGPLGGFVPRLAAAGYQATGVDPEAPSAPGYRQAEFENCELSGLDAIVACTSLHHVADLGAMLDLVAGALAPGGAVVIVEWARERFDEATARWCFDRLPESGADPGWLTSQRDEWRDSGLSWDAWLHSWAEAEQLGPDPGQPHPVPRPPARRTHKARVIATFVFIHGAGDAGWYLHLTEAELRARGHLLSQFLP